MYVILSNLVLKCHILTPKITNSINRNLLKVTKKIRITIYNLKYSLNKPLKDLNNMVHHKKNILN